MSRRPTLVVFLGGHGDSPAEGIVADAKRAASTDSIEAALSSGACDRAILVTDGAAGVPANLEITVDIDRGPFHFGERLAGVIQRYDLEGVIYMGGGSAPLLDGAAFGGIARVLLQAGHSVTNNTFSSDVVAFRASREIVDVVRVVERDNALARALQDNACAVEELPRTVATQMDIDGPTDLAILSLVRLGGPRLLAFLSSLDIDLRRYQEVLPLLTDREAQIIVAGRVGSHVWQYLERETACRVRLFAEERGLEARGRDGTRARSLLGLHIDAVGVQRFFEELSQLGDAAFIDSRVLLAHMGIEATREDRFLSDLGAWPEMDEPFLRDFTRAAVQAPMPVILGGHSLMSGGLMALNEHAWREHEAHASS